MTGEGVYGTYVRILDQIERVLPKTAYFRTFHETFKSVSGPWFLAFLTSVSRLSVNVFDGVRYCGNRGSLGGRPRLTPEFFLLSLSHRVLCHRP